MSNVDFPFFKFFPEPSPIIDFLNWLTASYEQQGALHVLDIGCGFGRIFKGLVELGWIITGLEPDTDFFYQAIDNTRNIEDQVVVRQGGFLSVHEKQFYELVIAINDPFAYLLSIEDRIEALRLIWEALVPKGVLLIDVPNFVNVLKNYEKLEDRVVNIADQTLTRRTYQSLDYHNNTWTNIDVYSSKTMTIRKTQTLAMLNFPELSYFLRKQGFINIRTYNSYNSRNYELLLGKRILISAQKPE